MALASGEETNRALVRSLGWTSTKSSVEGEMGQVNLLGNPAWKQGYGDVLRDYVAVNLGKLRAKQEHVEEQSAQQQQQMQTSTKSTPSEKALLRHSI